MKLKIEEWLGFNCSEGRELGSVGRPGQKEPCVQMSKGGDEALCEEVKKNRLTSSGWIFKCETGYQRLKGLVSQFKWLGFYHLRALGKPWGFLSKGWEALYKSSSAMNFLCRSNSRSWYLMSRVLKIWHRRQWIEKHAPPPSMGGWWDG